MSIAAIVLVAAAAGYSPAPALHVVRGCGLRIRAPLGRKGSGMAPSRLALLLVGPLES